MRYAVQAPLSAFVMAAVITSVMVRFFAGRLVATASTTVRTPLIHRQLGLIRYTLWASRTWMRAALRKRKHRYTRVLTLLYLLATLAVIGLLILTIAALTAEIIFGPTGWSLADLYSFIRPSPYMIATTGASPTAPPVFQPTNQDVTRWAIDHGFIVATIALLVFTVYFWFAVRKSAARGGVMYSRPMSRDLAARTSAFVQRVRKSQGTKQALTGDDLLVCWPADLVPRDRRRRLAARSQSLKIGAIATPVIAWTVSALTAWFYDGTEVGPGLTHHDRILLVVEFLLLSAMVAGYVFSRVLLPVRYPRSLNLQLEMLALLAAEPGREQYSAAAWGDPLGSRRAALDHITRGLRLEARRAERAQQFDSAVPPYALVMRGTARQVERFVSNRESLTGQLSSGLEALLCRTVAVIAGAESADTLRALAESVHAYQPDGSPDPDLVARTPRWIITLGHAVPGRIESVRRTLESLCFIAVVIMVAVLAASRHLPWLSLPSMLK